MISTWEVVKELEVRMTKKSGCKKLSRVIFPHFQRDIEKTDKKTEENKS
jgi:hypothetical protein